MDYNGSVTSTESATSGIMPNPKKLALQIFIVHIAIFMIRANYDNVSDITTSSHAALAELYTLTLRWAHSLCKSGVYIVRIKS